MHGGTNFQPPKKYGTIKNKHKIIRVINILKIEISNTERQELKKTVAKRSNSHSQVVRSRIILLSESFNSLLVSFIS